MSVTGWRGAPDLQPPALHQHAARLRFRQAVSRAGRRRAADSRRAPPLCGPSLRLPEPQRAPAAVGGKKAVPREQQLAQEQAQQLLGDAALVDALLACGGQTPCGDKAGPSSSWLKEGRAPP